MKEIGPGFNVPDIVYSKTLYKILSKSAEQLWRRNMARNGNDPAIIPFCYTLLAKVKGKVSALQALVWPRGWVEV